ncbi:MAG: hypothetical protein FWD76_05910 [Firmicutes bacterium]|nr:hypothetical protein [Bacillota bacterium]
MVVMGGWKQKGIKMVAMLVSVLVVMGVLMGCRYPEFKTVNDFYGDYVYQIADLPFDTKFASSPGGFLSAVDNLDEMAEAINATGKQTAVVCQRAKYEYLFLKVLGDDVNHYFLISKYRDSYEAGRSIFGNQSQSPQRYLYDFDACYVSMELGGEWYDILFPKFALMTLSRQVGEQYFLDMSFEQLCDFYQGTKRNDFEIDETNQSIVFEAIKSSDRRPSGVAGAERTSVKIVYQQDGSLNQVAFEKV